MTDISSQCREAVELGLAGDWDAAHAIVQDGASASEAWVHAWLHRVEGDLGNAGYWYRRAGRPMPQTDTETEGRAILAALTGS